MGLRRVLGALVTRANALTVLAGMGCITYAAFLIDVTLGFAALGGALIVSGLDVRRLR